MVTCRNRLVEFTSMKALTCVLTGILVASTIGCRCAPMSSCGTACGPQPLPASGLFSNCDSCDGTTGCATCRLQGIGSLLGRASCAGACGEVYVDPWLNEKPCPDNCGYDCGGCGVCGQCRPLLSVLKLLWGRPYRAACGPSLLCSDDSCGGCESCDGFHSGETIYESAPGAAPIELAPPVDNVQPIVPSPAPTVTSTSARIKPVKNGRNVQSAAYRRIVRQ